MGHGFNASLLNYCCGLMVGCPSPEWETSGSAPVGLSQYTVSGWDSSLVCRFCPVWQHLKLSEQIHPWDTLLMVLRFQIRNKKTTASWLPIPSSPKFWNGEVDLLLPNFPRYCLLRLLCLCWRFLDHFMAERIVSVVSFMLLWVSGAQVAYHVPEFWHSPHWLWAISGIQIFCLDNFGHAYTFTACFLSLVSLLEWHCSDLIAIFTKSVSYFQAVKWAGTDSRPRNICLQSALWSGRLLCGCIFNPHHVC